MINMDIENITMQLITCAGDARTYSYEALKCANEGRYKKAEELFKMAEKEIEKAYDIQKEVSELELDSEELLVDAKSHLNAAISEKNIIGELIGLRKIVRDLSKDEDGVL